VGDRALELGGGKQRAVLAALLLCPGELVSVERLVDDVWGDRPPASAGHSLEAYVSRLRRLLAPVGVALERRGTGYRIELGEATLDARDFELLIEQAAAARYAARAGGLVAEALRLWRGPPLADVKLHLSGESERRRLEELRLRALEIRFDAELELGRHRELVGELRGVVDENPYRERVVAQLMIALYRSGRQAEALELYERTRKLLTADLGVGPGTELQQLSGEIVRHERKLAVPVAPLRALPVSKIRRAVVLAAAAAAIAAVAIAIVAVISGGHPGPGNATAATSARVALIVPRAPTAGREDTFVTPFVEGLRRAAHEYDIETETFVLDEMDANPRPVERVARSLRAGGFDLVLSAGPGPRPTLLLKASRLPHARFVYLDTALRGSPLEGRRNLTGLAFADDDSGFLAGYLSGLVGARLSVVAGLPVPSVTDLVQSFVRGARMARPAVKVRVDYAHTFTNQAICERIANGQIDQGSNVVFAAAGTCGLGALAAAGIRGAWGVGADADRSYAGSHVLASTVKRYDRAVELAVRWYLQGTLPQGDVVLGLDDEAVGITGINPAVTAGIRRQVAHVEASLRAAEAAR